MFKIILLLILLINSKIACAEVIFEKKVDEVILRQHEITGSGRTLDKNISKEELKKEIDIMKKKGELSKTIIKIVLDYKNDGSPYFETSCLGKDLVVEAEKSKWRDEAKKRLSIGKSIGIFKYDATSPSREKCYDMFFEDSKDQGRVTDEYLGPPRRLTEATIEEVADSKISIHEFLREVIQWEIQIEKTKSGVVVKALDKFGPGAVGTTEIAWLSGDHWRIGIRGGIRWPDDLAGMYLEKFPSTLPNDLKIDKDQWGRDEVDLWLGRLKKSFDLKDEPEVAFNSTQSFERIAASVFCPPWREIGWHGLSLELKIKHYETISKWWSENKDKTYWDDNLRRLAAKGFTPKDIVEAAAKAKVDARNALLNAPLPADDELKKQVIQKFEKEKKDWMARAGPERGIKFEKTDEGTWVWHWRQSKGSALTEATFTGPEMIISNSKRYPLEGKFTSKYDSYGQLVTDYERFYFDRLESKWTDYKSKE